VNDKPTPLWQKLTAGGCYVALAAALAIFHARVGADFWPLDSSRVGPNFVASVASVAQAAVVFPFLVLLWPPARRRLHRFMDRKLAPIHEHLERGRTHDEWAFHAIHAMHHGEPLPDHPHFTTNERTP
jgi:fumarate reductase subunit D